MNIMTGTCPIDNNNNRHHHYYHYSHDRHQQISFVRLAFNLLSTMVKLKIIYFIIYLTQKKMVQSEKCDSTSNGRPAEENI